MPDPLSRLPAAPAPWASADALPLATLREELLVCPECDLLHALPFPRHADDFEQAVEHSGRHLECRRCAAPLGLARHDSFDAPAALAVATLAALAIAHLNPVLSIEIQGQTRSATLWEAAWTLWDDGSWLVTFLVLFTTLVNPVFEAMALCWLLLPLRRGRLAPGFEPLLRAVVAVRPWVMVEVFMLGVLVAFVKLTSLAEVVPGVGLWAFAAAMLLTAGMAWSFDVEHVWASTARVRGRGRNLRGLA